MLKYVLAIMAGAVVVYTAFALLYYWVHSNIGG